MLCLQIDLGNSGAKWRLVRGGSVSARGRADIAGGDLETLLDSTRPAADEVWVSSVAGEAVERELARRVQQCWGLQPWFARTPARCAGLVNSYPEPARMGVDRWLAMLGARARERSRLCVVDAGSALTIDLVDAAGRHEGGYIIPGAALMERALLLDTDRVRFDEDVPAGLAPGASTAAAVRHGIALAQVGALAAALQVAGEPRPAVYFCGGGGESLRQLAGMQGQFVEDLVFEGLEVMASERGRAL